jgi:hypothetical protein
MSLRNWPRENSVSPGLMDYVRTLIANADVSSSYRQAGDSDRVTSSVEDLIYRWCAELLIEFHESSQRSTGQGSAIPAFGNCVGSHRSGIFASRRRTSSKPGAGSASCSSALILSMYSTTKLDPPEPVVLTTLTGPCSCSFKSSTCSGRSTIFVHGVNLKRQCPDCTAEIRVYKVRVEKCCSLRGGRLQKRQCSILIPDGVAVGAIDRRRVDIITQCERKI